MFSIDAETGDGNTKSVILIAEDDENDICLLKRAFHKAGLGNVLQVVRNGEQAIAYLDGQAPFSDRQSHPPAALVVLDLKMPLKDGFEVLTWIRQQPEFDRLPVVVLTSSRESRDINRAYALGANSYMVKPASSLRLAEMVARLKEYCSFTMQNAGSVWP